MKKIFLPFLIASLVLPGSIFSQTQSQIDQYKGTASGTNSYSVTISPATFPLYNGERITVTFTNSNTTAATLRLSNGSTYSVTAINLNGAAIASGDIPANTPIQLTYVSSGPSWSMTKPGNSGGSPPPGGWGLTGNASTVDGTNFIGTTDNIPFNIRVNNQKAGRIDQTLFNVFYGYQAGNSNTTGSLSAGIGYRSLFSNTIGARNTGVGLQALFANVDGTDNTAVGYLSLSGTTSGTDNVGIGTSSGAANITGSRNTLIGSNATVGSSALTDATAIGYGATVNQSNSLILGQTGTKVGIGNLAPGALLDIGNSGITNGTIRLQSVTAGYIHLKPSDVNTTYTWTFPPNDGNSGQVLQTDGAGLLTWETQSGGWGLTGNAGTVDGTNFIGTTDNIPFNFKVNNIKAGRIDQTLFNVFLGQYSAAFGTVTGINNTGIGHASFYNITSGSNNVGTGGSTGYLTTTGGGNTFNGFKSGYTNSTGYYNTAQGSFSLYSNSVGSSNTAIGNYAGYLSTGSYNIFLGDSAGHAWTGSNRLFIGNKNYDSIITANIIAASSRQVNINALLKATGTTNDGSTNILLAEGLDGTDRFKIRTDGMSAFGTTAYAGYRLAVLDDGTNVPFMVYDGTSPNLGFSLLKPGTGEGNCMRMGMGVTTPLYNVHIKNGTGDIFTIDGGSNAHDALGLFGFGTTPYVGDDTRVYILGLGNTTTSATLYCVNTDGLNTFHVSDTGYVGINFTGDPSASIDAWGRSTASTGYTAKFRDSGGNIKLSVRDDGLITAGGDVQLSENTSIKLDPAGSADGKYSGTTITGIAGTTLAFGDVIYLAAADSRWELTDADEAATSGDVLVGICVLAAAGDGSETIILLNGIIRADANFPALTISAPVYISTTTGDVQVAAPSGTDDVVRRLGFALTADEFYFNPSNDYVTIQ